MFNLIEVSTTGSKLCSVKFAHSPILHYAFSSWIEKTMKKNNTSPLGKQICFRIVLGEGEGGVKGKGKLIIRCIFSSQIDRPITKGLIRGG